MCAFSYAAQEPAAATFSTYWRAARACASLDQVQLDSESARLVTGNDERLIYAPDDHDGVIRAVASDADDNEPAPPAAPPGTFFDQGPGGATAWVPNTSDDDDDATV